MPQHTRGIPSPLAGSFVQNPGRVLQVHEALEPAHGRVPAAAGWCRSLVLGLQLRVFHSNENDGRCSKTALQHALEPSAGAVVRMQTWFLPETRGHYCKALRAGTCDAHCPLAREA